MDKVLIETRDGQRAVVDNYWSAALDDFGSTMVAGQVVRIVRHLYEPTTITHAAETPDQTDAVRDIGRDLQDLLYRAMLAGVVVTVELEPLAMRKYRMVGDVRGAR